MSAITGIFLRNRDQISPEQIKKMNECLNHRGPDGSSIWNEGSVGLGHQMLFTTPESLYEKLPFEEDDLIITAEARIDNRKELSELLEIKDDIKNSDSYFILKAYEKWGEDCPDKLLGDFVFAIWDKSKEKLFCARDHLGIKPLYYYMNEEMFLFSTEMKAIFTFLGFKPSINDDKLAQTLVYVFEGNNNTFYKDIYLLPPGHKSCIGFKNFNIEQYWVLDPNLKLKLESDQDYKDAFLDIFTECIRCRLRSAYPVGFELSGGIDSSSVTAVACKINEEEKLNLDMHSYNGYFKEPKTDETFYAKAVVEDQKINAHFLLFDDVSPLLDIEQVIWSSEMPYMPFSNYIPWTIYSKVPEDGYRVILNGTFGDNVLAVPFSYLNELFSIHNIFKFFKELKVVKKRFNLGYKVIFINLILYPLIPNFIKKFIRKHTEEPFDEILFKKNSDFTLKTDIKNVIKNSIEKERKQRRNLTTSHYLDITNPIIPFIFEYDYSISSVNSVEMRYPYFDKRLVEFCYSLPSDLKVRDGWDKYIIRSSLDGILPEEVQWRRDKTNYANNFYQNLSKFEKEKIGEILHTNKDILQKYVDIDGILRLYEDFKADKLYAKYKKGEFKNMMALWGVIILALWLKNSE